MSNNINTFQQVMRADEEKRMAERKKQEEERRVREIEEKKQRDIEEKRRRLEEAEKKRQAMMQALKVQNKSIWKKYFYMFVKLYTYLLYSDSLRNIHT